MIFSLIIWSIFLSFRTPTHTHAHIHTHALVQPRVRAPVVITMDALSENVISSGKQLARTPPRLPASMMKLARSIEEGDENENGDDDDGDQEAQVQPLMLQLAHAAASKQQLKTPTQPPRRGNFEGGDDDLSFTASLISPAHHPQQQQQLAEAKSGAAGKRASTSRQSLAAANAANAANTVASFSELDEADEFSIPVSKSRVARTPMCVSFAIFLECEIPVGHFNPRADFPCL
jgi:hypothetical protein